MTTHPLDAMPDTASEAATLLRQMADISARAQLLNMERRLRALAVWAEQLETADTVSASLRALDAELVSTPLAPPVPAPSIPSRVVPAPAAEAAPVGQAITKSCQVCGTPFVVRSNRQRMCDGCRANPSHRSVQQIAGTQAPDSTCTRCGRAFVKAPGNAGKYCSRECYEQPGFTDDEVLALLRTRGQMSIGRIGESFPRANRYTLADHLAAMVADGRVVKTGLGKRMFYAVPEPPSAPSARATQTAPVAAAPLAPPPATQRAAPANEPPAFRSKDHHPPPERRCGRCMKKFRPATLTQYVCSSCVKPTAPKPEPPPEGQTIWAPGKDAPSLTGDARGLGSTLGGDSFKVHR